MPDREPRRVESVVSVRSDLLERWDRWRRSTVAFTETTTRTSGSEKLTDDAEIAQRFPDRIVRDGDDISAEIGGRQIGCSTTDSAPAQCFDSGSADPEERVVAELDELRTLTEGAAAPYRLSRTDASCFRLRHVVQEPRPRWGDRLDLCFDDRTGVVRSEVTVIGPLTISVARREVRTDVDDDDFKLPADPA